MFQPNLGPVQKRRGGSTRGWVQETYVCKIKRSVRISTHDYTHTNLHLFYDGEYAGYSSAGFAGPLYVPYNFQARRLFDAVDDIFGTFFESRHHNTAWDFEDFGTITRGLYVNGTTKATAEALSDAVKARFVMGFPPLIITELSKLRFKQTGAKSDQPVYKVMNSAVRFFDHDDYRIIAIERNFKGDKFARQARLVLARLYCEFALLENAVRLLASKEGEEISQEHSQEFCDRLSVCLSRLTGSKRISALQDPEFYEDFTRIFLHAFDASKVEALAHGLEAHGARRNLRNALLSSHLWTHIANLEKFELVKEKIMGSKYEIKDSQVGAIGDGAKAENISFDNSQNFTFSDKEIANIAAELTALRLELAKLGSPEAMKAALEIAEAEQSASQKDEPKFRDHLKKAGKWALETATKIGVTVAAAAIKKAAGL